MDHLIKFRFVDHADPQFSGPGQLTARFLTRKHQTGLLADGAGTLAAMLFDHLGDLFAAVGGQGTRDHDGQARKLLRGSRCLLLKHIHTVFPHPLHRFTVCLA